MNSMEENAIRIHLTDGHHKPSEDHKSRAGALKKVSHICLKSEDQILLALLVPVIISFISTAERYSQQISIPPHPSSGWKWISKVDESWSKYLRCWCGFCFLKMKAYIDISCFTFCTPSERCSVQWVWLITFLQRSSFTFLSNLAQNSFFDKLILPCNQTQSQGMDIYTINTFYLPGWCACNISTASNGSYWDQKQLIITFFTGLWQQHTLGRLGF